MRLGSIVHRGGGKSFGKAVFLVRFMYQCRWIKLSRRHGHARPTRPNRPGRVVTKLTVSLMKVVGEFLEAIHEFVNRGVSGLPVRLFRGLNFFPGKSVCIRASNTQAPKRTKRVRKSFLTNFRCKVSLLACGLEPRDKEGKHGYVFFDGAAATAVGAVAPPNMRRKSVSTCARDLGSEPRSSC